MRTVRALIGPTRLAIILGSVPFVFALVLATAPVPAHAEPDTADAPDTAETADAPAETPAGEADEVEREEAEITRRATRVRSAPWVRALPAPMRKRGPLGMLYVDWVALFVLVPASILLSFLVFVPIRALVRRITARTETTLDDTLAPALKPYARGLLALGLFHLGAQELSLPRKQAERLAHLEHLVLVALLLFAFVRVVRVIGDAAIRSPWARANPSSRSLVPLAVRAGDVLAWIAAFLAMLSTLGFDIGALLTGLGVGGVIVALAAQKTVENLLGAFALGIDQPMREGDAISVDGVVGTVERIGLRSTRIRTLDRTVVVIPNARLADMSIESFAARDRIRVAAVIGLVYDTPPDLVRRVRDAITSVVEAHPKRAPDPIVVRMRGLGPAALEIELMAWFTGTSYAELAETREAVLLDVLTAVRDTGAELAIPPRPAAGLPSAATAQLAQTATTKR